MTFLSVPFGLIGIIGHLLGSCGHMAAVILTGVLRYRYDGERCADFEEPVIYNTDKDTFKYSDHANTIQGLFISACVLLCYFNCFVIFMMKVSRGLIDEKRLRLK